MGRQMFKVEGLKELDKALKELPRATARNVVLRTLKAEVARALAKTTDRSTRLHLDDVSDQIAKILDPKFGPPAPAGPSSFGTPRPSADDLNCWTDVESELLLNLQ